jgi:hypothetical protein
MKATKSSLPRVFGDRDGAPARLGFDGDEQVGRS